MNGAELFVRELQQRGVTCIATLCGHGLNPLDLACQNAGMRLVDVRNEQAASYMAEVTGRLSRRVGVCSVSSGVAHVNALTGVVNAHFDGAPMLLVTGSGATETIGRGHFQDLDQVALAAPVCKYARLVDRAERIPHYLHEAFAHATSGRPGPVHLTVPLDVWNAPVDPGRLLRGPAPSPPTAAVQPGDPERIAEAAELLAAAERPLVVAGSGVFYAGGETALASFARALSIPVGVPIWDRGSISQPIEEFVGVFGAATGGPRLLPDADLVVMLGARCDYRIGYLQPPALREGARIVRVDGDPLELQQGVGAHVPILGDPRSVLLQLSDACKARGVSPKSTWLAEARARREAFRRQCWDAPRPPEGLHARDIIQAVQSVLTDDTILLIDGGNIGQWAHQLLCDRYPGHWLTCGASGVIGYGIPGAMAARLLYTDRPIILISGDGSLTFTVAEFESAARHNLSFVTVLADDQAWGITLIDERTKYPRAITSELGPIRYAQMADAFGAHGVRIENAGEIAPAIQQGLAAAKPTLIHVPIARSSPAER